MDGLRRFNVNPCINWLGGHEDKESQARREN